MREQIKTILAASSAPFGDCILWLGARSSTGHGVITINNQTKGAHVAAYFVEHGEWPASDGSTVVMHKCNVPSCINPAHLVLGNRSMNALHSFASGRKPSQKSRFNEEDADIFRILHDLYGIRFRTMARVFDADHKTIIRHYDLALVRHGY